MLLDSTLLDSMFSMQVENFNVHLNGKPHAFKLPERIQWLSGSITRV